MGGAATGKSPGFLTIDPNADSGIGIDGRWSIRLTLEVDRPWGLVRGDPHGHNDRFPVGGACR